MLCFVYFTRIKEKNQPQVYKSWHPPTLLESSEARPNPGANWRDVCGPFPTSLPTDEGWGCETMAGDRKQALTVVPLDKLRESNTGQGPGMADRGRLGRKAEAEDGSPSECGQLTRLGRETVRKRRVREQASQRREFPQDKERERSKKKGRRTVNKGDFFQRFSPSTSKRNDFLPLPWPSESKESKKAGEACKKLGKLLPYVRILIYPHPQRTMYCHVFHLCLCLHFNFNLGLPFWLSN